MRNPSGQFVGSASSLLAGLVLLTAAHTTVASAQSIDPPGFGPISVKGTQVVRLNVVCFDHTVGYDAPAPCRGEVMFHDAAGRELKRASYDLAPGATTTLQLAIPATDAAGAPIRRVAIIPCILPQPGGVAVPSAEVYDRDAGRVVLSVNPAAARMSEFNNSLADPGSISGFDPQPDPPAYSMYTMRTDQSMRVNLFCFEHPINGVPPEACRGTVMFHDAAGNVLKRAAYTLAPGTSQSLGFAPAGGRVLLVGIVPCVVPDPGGRAATVVEVSDAGGTVVQIVEPVTPRASRLKQTAGR